MLRPTLTTPRLLLRPFTLEDAPRVAELLTPPEIAATTLNIPYPYDLQMAIDWISTHETIFERGEGTSNAIILRESNQVIGAIGLGMGVQTVKHQRAEMGYWLGVSYWKHGYMTEAASALVRYSFEIMELNKIYASHFVGNPASGRVMQKIGMTYEGILRQHLRKDDHYEDLATYSILKQEWENQA